MAVRSYTLRLNGKDHQDKAWQQDLLNTHIAINHGTKAFGDWLLTMRGGICHSLANDEDIRKQKQNRIVLALSWLSVEDKDGAPSCKYQVNNENNEWQTVEALKSILKSRNVSEEEINQWVEDCKDSLEAKLRDDACWVNRSKMFDEKLENLCNRDDIWDFLGRFFAGGEKGKKIHSYLKIPKIDKDEKSDSTGDATPKSKRMIQPAGGWLSERHGMGEGANFEELENGYRAIAEWSCGDWLLTMRGGICHNLANDKDIKKRKQKRIELALSWLSVEDKAGAPSEKHRVKQKDGKWKTVTVLEKILKDRGVCEEEINQWVADCKDSLKAKISDDACWVNRSEMFDKELKNICSRDNVWEFLGRFFLGKDEGEITQSYIKIPKIEKEEKSNNAGGELSERHSVGVGADFEKGYRTIAKRVFGDRLPTMRGGICHNLANDKDIKKRKQKRIELALSWLSVEDKDGAPSCKYQVNNENNEWQTVEALKSILKSRNVSEEEINQWVADCKDSLEAKIQDDACWVNRRKVFDEKIEKLLSTVSERGHKSITKNILKEKRISVGVLIDLYKKANNDANTCNKKIGNKGEKKYSNKIIDHVAKACEFPYHEKLKNGTSKAKHHEYSVMLDHAARKLSATHSWVKRQEAERQNFNDNIKNKDSISSEAKQWLDYYCEERGRQTGTNENYTISKKAIKEWKVVVEAWKRKNCEDSEEARIEAIKEIQAESDNFGDAYLFERLAADDAKCVWQQDSGKSDKTILENYVATTNAERKKRHFKVPMYRHNDPYFHPIFCDYGDSRLNISYKIHQTKKNPNAIKKAVEELAFLTHRNSLEMAVITKTGEKPAQNKKLIWQSKRLVNDLNLKEKPSEENYNSTEPSQAESPIKISRNTRFGRNAETSINNNRAVKIRKIFEEEHWNSRLQAPRDQLRILGKLYKKNDEQYKAATKRLRWFLTFSPDLEPDEGPWKQYVDGCDNKVPFLKKGEINYTGWPYGNEGAERMLSGLSAGLRVLSVDLGLRHAAACAVWETLTTEQMQEACEKEGVAPPTNDAVYCHLKSTTKTTIYRRIGADTLDAPWAKLDRQFLIKLQGEERKARLATAEELLLVHKLEEQLGKKIPLIDRLVKSGWGKENKAQKKAFTELKQEGWKQASDSQSSQYSIPRPAVRVDELMTSAIATLKTALKRHGHKARIAHYLVTNHRDLPGGKQECLDNQGRVGMILKALMLWHELKGSEHSHWSCGFAQRKWEHHIDKKQREIEAINAYDPDKTPQQRRKDKQVLKEALEPVAAELRDKNLCKCLFFAWKKQWEKEDQPLQKCLRQLRDWILPKGSKAKDKNIRNVGGLSNRRITTIKTLYQLNKALEPVAAELRDKNLCKCLFFAWKKQWEKEDQPLQKCLRQLRDWILPKGSKAKDKNIRNVGGLSNRRITTIKTLYQLNKAFFTRMNPEGESLNAPAGFGRYMLEDLENMRDQRVKQTASRIIEACLGLGRLKKEENQKDPKRHATRVDESCHAIVIENLENYSPDQMRTRRENRQLMDWSSSKIKKYLEEGCKLHGIHLREVGANYTSRQDARTGAPGKRCTDITYQAFKDSPYWQNQLQKAKNKEDENRTPLEKYLCDIGTDHDSSSIIRIPQNGGDVFVPANSCNCCDQKAMSCSQADLNAAANVGLRALLDPDWPGTYWKVLVSSKTFKPTENKGKASNNSHVIEKDIALEPSNKKIERSGKIYFWKNISGSPIKQNGWLYTKHYWDEVEKNVIKRLKQDQKNEKDTANSKPT